MQERVWRTEQNMDVPVADHRQRPLRAVLTRPIRLQIHLIGPHIHIEHGGREPGLQTRRGLSAAGLLHAQGKGIQAEPVRSLILLEKI